MCELSSGNRVVSKNLSVNSKASRIGGLLSMNFHNLAFQFQIPLLKQLHSTVNSNEQLFSTTVRSKF